MDKMVIDEAQLSEIESLASVLKNNIATRSVRRMESQKLMFSNYWDGLSALDRDIVYYIANIEECTSRLLAELTGKSRTTITKHLKSLCELNIIKENGTAPTKYYTIRY